MTNEYIKSIALEQSALEFGCRASELLGDKHIFTLSKKIEGARAYLPLPFEFDMITYGGCAAVQTSEALAPIAREYLEKYDLEHAFETPHIDALNKMLAPHGLKVCFMAEYFLPDVNAMKVYECNYETRLLHSEDFTDLYTDAWSNALCKERAHLDVLAVGAYDNGKLIGLAGCSADCREMYQIGIDVLPEYRRQGIAAALTSKLAAEIVKLGKVPFYCAAWCNLKSVGNALKCGFRPAWVELTARRAEFVDTLNKR